MRDLSAETSDTSSCLEMGSSDQRDAAERGARTWPLWTQQPLLPAAARLALPPFEESRRRMCFDFPKTNTALSKEISPNVGWLGLPCAREVTLHISNMKDRQGLGLEQQRAGEAAVPASCRDKPDHPGASWVTRRQWWPRPISLPAGPEPPEPTG